MDVMEILKGVDCMKKKKVLAAMAFTLMLAMNMSAFAHETVVVNGTASSVVDNDRLTDEEVKQTAHERAIVPLDVDWNKTVTLEDVAHLIWAGDEALIPKKGYVAPIAATASKDKVNAIKYCVQQGIVTPNGNAKDMPTTEQIMDMFNRAGFDITNCEELTGTDELAVVRTYLSLERRTTSGVGSGYRRYYEYARPM